MRACDFRRSYSKASRLGCAIALTAVAGVTTATQAAVTISSKPTKNMSCSSGVCTPTAKTAVLNVTDLTNMLAASDVMVAGTKQAPDIDVAASFSWVSASTLTLDAYHSLEIDNPVSDAGSGGLALVTNDKGTGGTFSFGAKGNVTFMGLANKLTINGSTYKLEGNIATLASDISAKPSGRYALATSYDAKPDGTYKRSPINTSLTGVFEGLGNTISDLSIKDKASGDNTGLFGGLGSKGTIRDVGVAKANVVGGVGSPVGVLVGYNSGVITNSHTTGKSSGIDNASVGGLAGVNNGAITRSYSSVAVSGSGNGPSNFGGLVGDNVGSITQSFATGAVSGSGGSSVGGLSGDNSQGTIDQSYATGAATDSEPTGVSGGLVGDNNFGTISQSYATGAVLGLFCEGGFVGYDDSDAGDISFAYWDTTTSGITNPSQGAGNISNDPGITALTTAQFQSELPSGFDPSIWGENAGINGGLPYLLALPPA